MDVPTVDETPVASHEPQSIGAVEQQKEVSSDQVGKEVVIKEEPQVVQPLTTEVNKDVINQQQNVEEVRNEDASASTEIVPAVEERNQKTPGLEQQEEKMEVKEVNELKNDLQRTEDSAKNNRNVDDIHPQDKDALEKSEVDEKNQNDLKKIHNNNDDKATNSHESNKKDDAGDDQKNKPSTSDAKQNLDDKQSKPKEDGKMEGLKSGVDKVEESKTQSNNIKTVGLYPQLEIERSLPDEVPFGEGDEIEKTTPGKRSNTNKDSTNDHDTKKEREEAQVVKVVPQEGDAPKSKVRIFLPPGVGIAMENYFNEMRTRLKDSMVKGFFGGISEKFSGSPINAIGNDFIYICVSQTQDSIKYDWLLITWLLLNIHCHPRLKELDKQLRQEIMGLYCELFEKSQFDISREGAAFLPFNIVQSTRYLLINFVDKTEGISPRCDTIILIIALIHISGGLNLNHNQYRIISDNFNSFWHLLSQADHNLWFDGIMEWFTQNRRSPIQFLAVLKCLDEERKLTTKQSDCIRVYFHKTRNENRHWFDCITYLKKHSKQILGYEDRKLLDELTTINTRDNLEKEDHDLCPDKLTLEQLEAYFANKSLSKLSQAKEFIINTWDATNVESKKVIQKRMLDQFRKESGSTERSPFLDKFYPYLTWTEDDSKTPEAFLSPLVGLSMPDMMRTIKESKVWCEEVSNAFEADPIPLESYIHKIMSEKQD